MSTNGAGNSVDPQDPSAYAQPCGSTNVNQGSPHHYYDIQSLAVTHGKPRVTKGVKQSTIWHKDEIEERRAKNKPSANKYKTATNTPNQLRPSGTNNRQQAPGSKIPAPKLSLDNPAYNQNWTLPRVELWCRDPNCQFNERVWGSHHHPIQKQATAASIPSPSYRNYSPPSPPPQPQRRRSAISIPIPIPEVEEDYLSDQTRSTYQSLQSRDDSNHTEVTVPHSSSLSDRASEVHTSSESTMPYTTTTSLPPPPPPASTTALCPNCSGVVPLNHLDGNDGGTSDIGIGNRVKNETAVWNFNKFQHPLQRDHSFHSVGGFTLNGQYNATIKKHRMVKFCSSHKISLVVSIFSLFATTALLITLLLMKQRGMMDTMMDN